MTSTDPLTNANSPNGDIPALPANATPEEKDLHWLHHYYQGDHQPQLTVRAVLIGGVLGMLMAVSPNDPEPPQRLLDVYLRENNREAARQLVVELAGKPTLRQEIVRWAAPYHPPGGTQSRRSYRGGA